MRENYVRERRFWNEGGPVMAKTVERTSEGPMGEFMARYYYPVEAEKLPVIEFIHGGGFVVGSPDTHDRVCRILAEKTGAVVVSVDYHLSPESKYPTNIQECVLSPSTCTSMVLKKASTATTFRSPAIRAAQFFRWHRICGCATKRATTPS